MFLKIYILSILTLIAYSILLISYIQIKYNNDPYAAVKALDKLEEENNNSSMKEGSTFSFWLAIALLTPILNTIIALLLIFSTPSTLKTIDGYFEDDNSDK